MYATANVKKTWNYKFLWFREGDIEYLIKRRQLWEEFVSVERERGKFSQINTFKNVKLMISGRMGEAYVGVAGE